MACDAEFVEISPGVRMPRLGLGTFKIRGADATRVTLDALRAGCRHIDTASCYRNEEEVRSGVDEWRRERRGDDVRTDDDVSVFVTSKIAPSEMGDARARDAIRGILKRLGRRSDDSTRSENEPLDLLLIHWPGKAKTPPDSDENLVARRETWNVLEDALDSGRVRAIGVSNYTSAHLLEMMREHAIRRVPSVNQVEFHPRCQQKELRATCGRLGIKIVAYSPLGAGELLTDPRVLRCAEALSARLGERVTPAKALLAWSSRQEGVHATIVKSSEKGRIRENVGVEGFLFAAKSPDAFGDAFLELDAMDDGTHFCWDPAVVK
jgi:diketogulonate reductase-like aldo/keto reductase